MSAAAGVNPQNGNFFITYKDISQQSAGRELNLVRTYNSKATALGWFGLGWGSPYETRLIAMPDGSAAVQEQGTGQISYYRPRGEADIERAITRIVDAAGKRGKLSPDAESTLRKSLAGDEDLRVQRVLAYGLQVELPANAALRSSDCSAGGITRIASTYRRVTCDRTNEYFDLQGRLLRREEGGYTVTINYQGRRPVSITDTLGQSIRLKSTPAGLLTESTNGKDRAVYAHDRNNNLISSHQADGLFYEYEYDANNNLTRIGYADKVSMRIEYSSPADGVVGSVTERSGDKTVYEYRADPANAGHTWTRVTAISTSGQRFSREYEYHRTTSETGAVQLANLLARDGRSAVEASYDGKGRIVRRANDTGGFLEYVYHPRNDKLILVLSPELDTEFHYDDEGQLTHAQTSKGRIIDLDYDPTAKIRRIVEVDGAAKSRRELTFKYNPAGRVSEINLLGTGRIAVEYDAKGEIARTTSSQGPAMALQITQAFQNVLGVVRVAGARLGM
jgi:YD repeat-containing protein